MLIADSGLLQSEYGRTAAAIAEAKMNLGFGPAFVRGILCNALVCVAVWMMVSARTITSKLAGLIFPISAFITLGFEHSIANFYLLTTGLLAHAGLQPSLSMYMDKPKTTTSPVRNDSRGVLRALFWAHGRASMGSDRGWARRPGLRMCGRGCIMGAGAIGPTETGGG
jgi:hypothetical protein